MRKLVLAAEAALLLFSGAWLMLGAGTAPRALESHAVERPAITMIESPARTDQTRTRAGTREHTASADPRAVGILA